MSGIVKPQVGVRLRKGHPLARGLVGAWLMNEGSGATVHDYSGNGNTGTLTNMDPATDWVATPNGWGLNFDGTDDYVACARPELLPDWPTSVVAGVQFASAATHDWILHQGTYRGWDFAVKAGPALAVAFPGVADYIFSGLTIPTSTPLVIGCSIPGNNMDATGFLFGGGAAESDTVTLGTMLGNRLSLQIAGASTDFDGDIYWVFVYGRTISVDEVRWLYREPFAMFEQPAPVWAFYEAPPAGFVGPLLQENNLGVSLFDGLLR